MNKNEALELLEQCSAICYGHFVYTKKEVPPDSGIWSYFHGDTYINKDEAFWRPTYLDRFAFAIAKRLKKKRIDVIVGPEKGAIGLAPLVALHLTRIQEIELLPPWGEVAACWSDKRGEEEMEIGRIFGSHIRDNPGCYVWIAEDIGNTGSSARKSVRAARSLGANVMGVSFIATHRSITSDDMDGVPVWWLAQVKGQMWEEEICPKCKEHGFESVNLEMGKGKEFLKRMGL